MTVAIAAVGCGRGSLDDPGAGGGGNAGLAGSAGALGGAGRGGAVGGGSAGSAAGASGAGGAAGLTDGGSDADAWIASGCATSTPPVSALITDFETVDGGAAVIPIGRMLMSGFDTSASVVKNGAWHVNHLRATFEPARGTLVFDACVDVRAYDGVSFYLAGVTNGCGLFLEIVDTAHGPSGGTFPNGSGSPGATPPRYVVPLPGGAGGMMTLRFPFNGVPGNETVLSPATPTDTAKLIGLQWLFFGNPTSSCPFDITIDDVAFYKDGVDGSADAPVD